MRNQTGATYPFVWIFISILFALCGVLRPVDNFFTESMDKHSEVQNHFDTQALSILHPLLFFPFPLILKVPQEEERSKWTWAFPFVWPGCHVL